MASEAIGEVQLSKPRQLLETPILSSLSSSGSGFFLIFVITRRKGFSTGEENKLNTKQPPP
jgi:hypothetical protein